MDKLKCTSVLSFQQLLITRITATAGKEDPLWRLAEVALLDLKRSNDVVLGIRHPQKCIGGITLIWRFQPSFGGF